VSKRVLILSAGVGSGHNMAGGVIERYLKATPGVYAEIVDVLELSNDAYQYLYGKTYFKLVDAVPWLVGWGYEANDPPFKLKKPVEMFDRINTMSTVRRIRDFNPDVVVCTHFLPARLASLLLAREVINAPIFVVTTDYDFQGLWLNPPFSRIFVAREETKAYMEAIGVPADRLTTSGIPVRPLFGEPVDADAVRKRYDLDATKPMLLVSAGAAGGSYTTAVVKQTLRMTNDFQAVVICGANAELKKEVEHLVAGREDQYRVLGFSSDMPDLLRIASLFVGKPGGLSSSECMAAGVPMVLIKPIPGQEDRNSDYLLESGAAVKCNYEGTIGYKLDEILSEPGRLERMAASARRIGHPDAAAKVAAAVAADDSPPVWITQAARESILTASEQGMSVVDLPSGQRLHTLYHRDSGRSAAVITEDQLDSLVSHQGARLGEGTLTVTAQDLVNQRRWRRSSPDLLLELRRAMGEATAVTFDLR
jgi:processive 1,2-diacylglycerol beta-glucosyltransferase